MAASLARSLVGWMGHAARARVLLPLVFLVMMAASSTADGTPSQARAFFESHDWLDADHLAAFQALARFCAQAPHGGEAACEALSHHTIATPLAARRFFETHYAPESIQAEGLLTAYYEPELPASRTRTSAFSAPLYRLPQDRVALPDRGAVMDGALEGEGLELVYLENAVEAFFVAVQGSVRLRFDDGTVMRVGFAGKSGHPYTAIGRVLVEEGALSLEEATMTGIRAWLHAHPEAQRRILGSNRSFIFFREITGLAVTDGPVGAAGVPLTAGVSIAVDPTHIAYGSPVFLAADDALPGESGPLRRLTIAADTGSAIRGPSRADLFLGSGALAGEQAGAVRLTQHVVVLRWTGKAGGDAP